MQSQSTSDNLLHSNPDAGHAPLWQAAFLILGIVFGPALIACLLNILH